MATNSSRLNLTRDQLASFLIDHQQIKQFEMLFSAVDAIAPNVVLEINIAVGTAQATANNAIDQIIALGQSLAVYDAVMSAKVQQALDAIPRLAQALELLASAPVEQPQAAAFDDLRPRAELGTMAAQNAANVNITGGTIAGITFGGFPAGTVSLPSLYWTTDTATGFYRIGANNIGYSYNGTKLLDFGSELLAITGGLSVTKQITSTLATGTAPLVVASTTNVANLNASSLGGATFAAPGPIGGGTASTGAFTTVTTTGTATVGTGTTTVGGIINGANSGTNGGSYAIIRNGGSSIIGFSNKSALLGGAYDATPLLYGNAAINVNVGMTITGAMIATTVQPTAASGYKSSDGTSGISTTVTTASLVGKTLTIKDGIITLFA